MPGCRYTAVCTELKGEQSAVELVAIVGYYTYVAYTLNAFKIPPPSAAL